MVTATDKLRGPRQFRGSGHITAFLRSSASSVVAHRLLFVGRGANMAGQSRRERDLGLLADLLVNSS